VVALQLRRPDLRRACRRRAANLSWTSPQLFRGALPGVTSAFAPET